MSQPLAHAAFGFDLDDLAEVCCRSVERSMNMRRRQQRTAIMGGLITSVLGGLILWPAMRLPPLLAVAVAVAGGVYTALRAPSKLRLRQHLRVRKALAESLGPGPHRCELDLFDDHVRTVENGVTNTWPWTAIESVRDDQGNIVMDLKLPSVRTALTPGLMIVRGRAFAREADRQSFLLLAQRLAATARARSSPASTIAAT